MPAHADTRSREDRAASVGEPRPPYDLRRVTWNYTRERFVVTSSPLRDLSASTSTSDTSEVLDEVLTSGRLTSG